MFRPQSLHRLLLLAFISLVCGCDRPLVKIDTEDFKGSMVGVAQRNIFNETFTAFLGIPYAKAPVGSLRFRDPMKMDKFEGTFDANHPGYECWSITATNASEDCLNLNVYRKQLNPTRQLPVLVMIHPGGLYLGSAKWMDPSYVLTQDVVLVTFNYRLGSLGFLNLGTEDIPGNAGFKDQAYALRWVKRNIAEFGGNPQDVTLMGYSAGALSVSLHLVSPMTQGLFHKAIIMSGSMPPQTKMPQRHQRYLAVRQAKRLNCSQLQEVKEEIQWDVQGNPYPDYNQFSDKDILACLSRYTGLEMANTLRQMFEFAKDNPIYLWLPVVEKDYGQERFLTEDFYTALNKMPEVKVPLLMGYTSGEFCTSSGDILKDPQLKAKFEREFKSLAPRVFGYETWANKNHLSGELLKFYFNGSSTFAPQDYDSLCDVFSDALIRYGAHRTAEIVSQKGSVHFYEFEYQGKPREAASDEMFPQKKERVEHMDDLQYLFNWSQNPDLSKEDRRMVELYTNFMYDFIKNGRLSNSAAKPYPFSYALIGDDLKYVEGRNFQNLKFWSDLFKDESRL